MFRYAAVCNFTVSKICLQYAKFVFQAEQQDSSSSLEPLAHFSVVRRLAPATVAQHS